MSRVTRAVEGLVHVSARCIAAKNKKLPKQGRILFFIHAPHPPKFIPASVRVIPTGSKLKRAEDPACIQVAMQGGPGSARIQRAPRV